MWQSIIYWIYKIYDAKEDQSYCYDVWKCYFKNKAFKEIYVYFFSEITYLSFNSLTFPYDWKKFRKIVTFEDILRCRSFTFTFFWQHFST